MVERLGEAMTAMLDKADEAFTTLIGKTEDKDAQGHYMAARDVAAKSRADIESEFNSRYLEEFSKRVREVRKALGTDQELEEAAVELELELVGEEDLEETLKFNDMAARLRRMCDAELGALDQRAAVLLGDANLAAEQNPFGSQAICGAYKSTCKHVDSDAKVRRALLKLFDDHFADRVRAVYKEVNDLLVENSILPKIKYAVKKTEGGAAGGAADGEEEGDVEDAVEAKVKKATDAAAAAGQDIFSIISKLMGPVTGPGGGPAPGTPGGPPAIEGAALLASLSQLQHGNLAAITSGTLALPQGGDVSATNVLAQLKTTNVGASMGQMDAMTLDVVSMLFDQIFDDPKVPAGVKALAGRLQIPILKIAIADKAIFSKKDHPARVLLDILGDFAGRLPQDFDKDHRTYPRLDQILHELIEGFEEKVEIFVAANEKLRALVAEVDAHEARETEAAAKHVDKRERLALARKDAEDEIRKRYEEGKTQRPVLDFLVTLWVKHLLIVHLQNSPESDVWKSALETMDVLIWSVKPKTDPVERKKLATNVPTLLKRINAGCNAAGVDEAARTAFFTQLMNMHTAVLHTPAEPEKTKEELLKESKERKAAREAAKKAKESQVTDALGRPIAPKAAVPGAAAVAKAAEAKAATAKAAKPVEEELDFTKPIAVKIGNEVVQVEKTDQLDFTAAPAPAAVAAAAAALEPPREVKLPSKLKEGIWVGLRPKNPDEPRQPAKLLYVSPLKSRFLFADKRGKTVLECTRADLSKRFRTRELVILAENPDASLFERIINGVLGKLGHA